MATSTSQDSIISSCWASCDAVFSKCLTNRTALYAAATRPHKHGARYNHAHPLQRIVDKESGTAVINLRSNTPFATPSDVHWLPPVFAACMYGRAANVELILSALKAETPDGDDPLNPTVSGVTPVHVVCGFDPGSILSCVPDDATPEERVETLHLLLRLRASRCDLYAESLRTGTPLLQACFYRHNLLIHALLDLGADPAALSRAKDWYSVSYGLQQPSPCALTYLRACHARARGPVQLDVLVRLMQLQTREQFIEALTVACSVSLPAMLVILLMYAHTPDMKYDTSVDRATAAARALLPLPAEYDDMCNVTWTLVMSPQYDTYFAEYDWWASHGMLLAWMTRADFRPEDERSGDPQPLFLWPLLRAALGLPSAVLWRLVQRHHTDAVRWPGLLQLLPRAYADYPNYLTAAEPAGYDANHATAMNAAWDALLTVSSNVFELLHACALHRRRHAVMYRRRVLRGAAASSNVSA